MLLQIALDKPLTEDMLRFLEEAQSFMDIAEIGTPCLYASGMEAVRRAKARAPRLRLLADMKIADAGAYEAAMAFDAGADYVTVLASAENRTIEACVKTARSRGGYVAADLIGVKDYVIRAAEIEGMGVDIVCAHTGYDMQTVGETPLSALRALKSVLKRAKISVAGGINARSVGPVSLLNPDIIVVGSGVTARDNPVDGVLAMRREIDVWTA